jgi:glutathione synthase/RimK-type ligase-like ATP-grasp enzyme
VAPVVAQHDGELPVCGRAGDGVWCRSVRRPAGDPAIADPGERDWAAQQTHAALAGMVRTLPGRWINHPDRTAAASHKGDQLARAAQLGLHVPRTLITGSGRAAADWAEQPGRPVLCKPFDPIGTLPSGWVPAAQITSPIPRTDLGAISIFQEIIYGAHMRVSVVGHRVFAAQITPRNGDLDWRLTQETADYRAAEVPPSLQEQLVAYLRHYGLVYGAFDLVVDAGGTWWFLECNAVGQYVFVETRTFQPITKAIVDYLCPASASHGRAELEVAS